MAETLVENQVCKACGAEVREGTLFCYNCGGKLASDETVAKKNKGEIVADSKLQEKTFNENGNAFRQTKVETKQAGCKF